jgi:ketosteroid isomerase-like protein
MPSAESVETAFYKALARGDLASVMALWADDDAIVCNHPSGPRLIGRGAVESSFREILSHGGLQIEPTRVHAVRTADMAVHSLIECITVSGPGGTQEIEVIATNIFVRTPGGWRLLMHHAGVAEDEDDEAGDFDDEDGLSAQTDDSDPSVSMPEGWGPGRPASQRLGLLPGETDPLDSGEDSADRPPTDRRRLH